MRKSGLTGGVDAGINWGLGNMFDYSGPMLWMAQFFHDATDAVRQAARGDRRASSSASGKEGLDQATLDRARVKMRSGLYANLEQFAGFGRANLLASFALFDDDPSRINRLEAEFAKVTPALVQKTAQRVSAAGQSHGLRDHAGQDRRGRKRPGREGAR